MSLFSNPRISVVLPTYNAEKTINRALESLLNQTHPPDEIVVVDDGSTDNTHEHLRRRNDIRLLTGPHRGIVAALNKGLSAARGDLIARMDADDTCHPQRLEKQLALLNARPEIGVAGCRVGFGGHRTRQAGYAAYLDWINELIEPTDIALNRFIESPLAHPSLLFRAELCSHHGAYRNGPFPEDYELWLRWMERGVRFAKVDEELLVWNDPPDRLSRTDPRYNTDAFYRIKADYLIRWLAQNNPHHPRVVLWGAGRVTRKRTAHLIARGLEITHYIDLKPRQLPCRTPVLTPDALPDPSAAFVLSMVGKRGARDLIRRRLHQHGFIEGRTCLFGG